MKRLLILFLCLFPFFISAADSTIITALPDISFIGETGLIMTQNSDEKNADLVFNGLEIQAQSALHPNADATFVVGAHLHEGTVHFDVEEAFVSFKSMPLNTGIKTGRKLTNFGRINYIHSHEWLFTGKPFIYSNFLGEHALMGDGASIDILLPLPFFLNVEAGIWTKPAEEHGEHEEGEEHHHSFSPAGEFYNLRLWSSFEISEASELEVGFSGLKGNSSHYLEHMDRINMAGADLIFKIWPSAFSRILLLTEVMYLKREVPPGIFESWGMYSFIGYKPDKHWEIGGKYDYSETPGPEKEKTSGLSAIVTNYITESFRIRAEYTYTLESKSHSGLLNIVFGIGPHTHPLQ